MIKREYWDLKLLKEKKEAYKNKMTQGKLLSEPYEKFFNDAVEKMNAAYGGFDGLDLMDAHVSLLEILTEADENQLSLENFVGDDANEFLENFLKELDIPLWGDKYLHKKKTKMNKKITKKLRGK